MMSASGYPKKKSLRTIILQAFTLLIVITVTTISLIFYTMSSKAIVKMSNRLTGEVTEKIIERTRMYLEIPAVQTQTIANLVQHRDIAEIHQELWRIIWEQLQVLEQVQAIFIGDERGSYVQVRRIPALATRLIDRRRAEPVDEWWYRNRDYQVLEQQTKPATYDPRVRSWYKNTPATKKITWTDVYLIKSTRTPGISPTYPLLDANGRKVGAVSISIPLHRLTDFITQQKVSDNGIVFITNRQNQVIVYPKRQSVVKEDHRSKKLRLITVNELEDTWVKAVYLQHTQTGENTIKIGGKRYLVNLVPFPKDLASQWQIAVIIPEHDLLGSINRMMIYTSMIASVIFLIAFISVYFVTKQVTRPITKLVAETAKIKNFELDEITGVHSDIKEVEMMNQALLSTVRGLQSFKKYVPADLVCQLLKLGREAKLGGENLELTILFSDIEGFTSLSENMQPQELMLHLSDYLSEMTRIITMKQGTIDKYIGDAVMAFWGAPLPVPKAPYLACKAALACQHQIEILNRRWETEGKPPLNTRFGLHTGNTVVGNLGSDERMNYTIIGDSVNLASRLEGTNKLYGTHIIISEDTYRQVAADFHCRLVDIVAVKGRHQAVGLYELLASQSETLPAWQQRFCQIYEQGLQKYFDRDWNAALDCFYFLQTDFPEDKSVALFINRCQSLCANSEQLPEQWNRTFVLTEK
jgi:adenylate cyclase